MVAPLQPLAAVDLATVGSERRASNARAVCLSLTLLGFATAATLLVIPDFGSNRATAAAVFVTAVVTLGGYGLARAGRVSAATLLVIAASLAQHTFIASLGQSSLVTPFFASIFVMVGSMALPRAHLLPVIALAGVTIAAQFLLGRSLGLDPLLLQGALGGALVLLGLVSTVVWLHLSGLERAFELVQRQQEARELLTLQLEKSARMEALGRLAGGIAHDFNNLLVVMQGSAELAAEDLPADHPAQEELRQIQEAATRAADLTSQLLSFSRRKLVPPAKVHPGRVVRELEPLLRRLVGGHLGLELSVRDEHDVVVASRTQLEQILLNLAANARDATERGGTLGIRVERRELNDGEVDDLPPGKYVEISVSDTGSGMPEEVLAHLFEPFFTTKGGGRGTGLGLATSFGIATQMGGTIAVESQVGVGSTFRLLLPLAVTTGAQSEARLRLPQRPRRVLVVDADDSVQSLVARILMAEGFEVLVAGDAPTCLETARTAAPLDVVLTDLVLGADDATRLLAELRGLQPGAAFVVMSSYSPDRSSMDRLAAAGATFLAKPFQSAQLVDAVLSATREAGAPGPDDHGAPRLREAN
jgi:signal transduction histidine kinase/ActR/RegA family two-component response regulator